MQHSGLVDRSRKAGRQRELPETMWQERKLLRRRCFDQSGRPEGAAVMGRRRSRGTVLPGRNRLGGSQEQERASREGDVQCRTCCPSEEGVCSGKAMGSGRNDLMCAI